MRWCSSMYLARSKFKINKSATLRTGDGVRSLPQPVVASDIRLHRPQPPLAPKQIDGYQRRRCGGGVAV
jgi:hypothetical protein